MVHRAGPLWGDQLAARQATALELPLWGTRKPGASTVDSDKQRARVAAWAQIA